ncbi:MAG: hypothetical protein KatS3mg031_3042 [Chitinophagales bacterium]|nr:MAG: hypothetical protein KatS3mg031_3042 [Chitinophagales bacterium]
MRKLNMINALKTWWLLQYLFVAFLTNAQNPDIKRTNHWYFGHFAGLDFSNGSPVPDTLGQISTLERTASISDTAGNLLFYFGSGYQTNNDWCIYNRNHEPMLDGCGIGIEGVSTPRDCAVFVPKPKDDSTYYLFTVDGWENQFQRGLRWHEIDLRLDSGLGGVVSKENLLFAPATEQLAVTKHCDGNSYWVVGHERSTANFRAYRVTGAGIDSVPVISNAGQDYGITQQSYNLNGGYHLVFSPNGQKALVQVVWNYRITGLHEQMQLIDFDSQTGRFSNAFDLPVDTTASHGFFSPDNLKVYFSSCYRRPCRFYQFDLSSGVDSIIQQSRTIVFSSDVAIESDGQIGADGKIYLSGEWDYITSTPNPHFLSVIESPNEIGAACNVQYGAQPLGMGRATQGLPNFVSNFLVGDKPASCQYTFNFYPARDMYEMLVYPNPADAQITISGNQLNQDNGTVRVIDMTGRILSETKLMKQEQEMTVDVSQIPNGLYLLELQTKNSQKAFRINIIHSKTLSK